MKVINQQFINHFSKLINGPALIAKEAKIAPKIEHLTNRPTLIIGCLK